MNQPVLDQDLVDLVFSIATEKNIEAKDVTLADIKAALTAKKKSQPEEKPAEDKAPDA